MNFIKKLYHWSLRRTDRFLFQLCREDKLWLAVHLSGIARTFFLREFSVKQVNYRNVEDLKQLVIKATKEQAAKPAEAQEKPCIPPGLKVLLVFSKYASSSYLNISTDSDPMESNFEDVWVKTATDAGLNVDTFYADKISYLSPDASNLEVMKQEGRKLLSKVNDFQPQLIFLDTNYLGNQNTINCDLIQEIRKIHSCKIAGFIGDFYSKEAFHTAEYWSKSLDILLHGEPEMPSGKLKNVHYMHYFQNEKSFYPASEKGKDITFSGSGNISRYVYLAVAKSVSKKRGYKHEVYVHNYTMNSSLSNEEYSRLIRESRAVLNLSARPAPGVRAVTGRVQQAIASKSLLIEEKNEGVARIFTPYAHYIPFDSKEELAIAIEFSVNCGKLVDKITEAAYTKYRREHSSKVVWSQILRLCNVSSQKV